jgi:hypothetical protein
VAMIPIDPPTHTCPELWIPSSAGPKEAKVVLAVAAMSAEPGSVANMPIVLVTVCGPVIKLTVGVNPRSPRRKGLLLARLPIRNAYRRVGVLLLVPLGWHPFSSTQLAAGQTADRLRIRL